MGVVDSILRKLRLRKKRPKAITNASESNHDVKPVEVLKSNDVPSIVLSDSEGQTMMTSNENLDGRRTRVEFVQWSLLSGAENRDPIRRGLVKGDSLGSKT